MSEIAAQLGGSKATLYSYFPSKEALFVEVLLESGRMHGEAAFAELTESSDIVSGLERFGERHLAFVLGQEPTATHRLAIAEGSRSELGREFYRRGPAQMLALLAERLRGAIQTGALKDEDPVLMAQQLKALYEADLLERRLYGDLQDIAGLDLAAASRRAVAIFMSYYGV